MCPACFFLAPLTGQFTCDPHAGHGVPVFQEETADCTYVFTWASASACVPTDLPPLDCVLAGPNYFYNLHALGRLPGQLDWTVRGASPARITMNVCGRLQNYIGSKCEVMRFLIATEIYFTSLVLHFQSIGHTLSRFK